MEGKTHASVGVAVGLATSLVLPMGPDRYESVLVGAGAAAVGALFADLDLDQSNGSKMLNKVLTIVIPTAVILVVLAVTGLIDLTKMKFKAEQLIAFGVLLGVGIFSRTRPHREFTHSILAMVLTTGCVAMAEQGELWKWFAVGYTSHLGIDLLNTKGESLLWPLESKFCLGLCRANGVVNDVLYYAGMIVGILVIVLKEGIAFG